MCFFLYSALSHFLLQDTSILFCQWLLGFCSRSNSHKRHSVICDPPVRSLFAMGRTARQNKRVKRAQAAAQNQMMMNPMRNPMLAMNPMAAAFMNPMMAAAMGAAVPNAPGQSSGSETSGDERAHRRPADSGAKSSSPAVPVQDAQQTVPAESPSTDPNAASSAAAAVAGDVFAQAFNRAMRGLDQHRADLYNTRGENCTITRSTALIRGLPKARLGVSAVKIWFAYNNYCKFLDLECPLF